MAAAAVAGIAGEAAATAFTMTVPGTSITLPAAYPQAGGVAIVMVGANGNVYYQFSDPTGAFVGFQNTGNPAAFRGNPFTINNPIPLNCGNQPCNTYFGGSIAQLYVRFSAFDGDTASGNFDFNRISLQMNGVTVGNWSTVRTEITNNAGTTSLGFQTGFGDNTFNTGWFSSTNAALLSNILSTGQTSTQVFDSTPNDNYWDFTQGTSLSNPTLRSIAPGYQITKAASTTTFSAVGQTITYSYTVTNVGSVRITNIVLSDNKISGVTCNKTTLVATAAGGAPDVATCTGTYVTTQADVDAGRVTNVAQATGTPDYGVLGAVTATATVTGPAAVPGILLTKTSTATSFGNAGTAVPYRFTVRNTGNVTLTNVTVTDPKLPALACTIASVAPNATASCNGTYTVTQADVDAWAQSGTQLTNTATAAGTTPAGGSVSATANRSLPGPAVAPALTVAKTQTPATYAAVGTVINYSIRVTNTGNVSFPAAPSINDPLVTNAGGAVTCPAGSVAPGAAITCTASYTVTQADIDARSVVNTATASVTVGGVTATNSGSVTATATTSPALTIVKRLAAGSPATFSAPGTALSYEYVLTNTGNITLTAPSVADNKVAVTCPAAPVAPGGAVTCTSAAYVTTQADVDAGGVTNTATASATPVGGTAPVATATPASVTVPSVQTPSFAIDKTAPAVASGAFSPGLVVTYSYTVTNTGNVTATQQIRVTDNRIGAPFNCGTPPYAPGASVTCTANYTVTAADVTAGLVQNAASASDGTTTSNTDTATIPQQGAPALALAKVASPATFATLADTITYTFTVTNAGSTTIVNPGQPITIADPKLSAITCSQPAVLSPGASFTCTGTYNAITQAELDAGQIVNSAVASFSFNTPGGPVTIASPSATETVTSSATPSFTIDKTGPATFSAVGQVLTYDFLITNTGVQTLATVTVTDPLIPALSCTRTNIAPSGGTATCSGTYTVTQADLDSGSITNTASGAASTAAGGSASANDTLVTPVAGGAQTRSMTVAKTASPTTFAAVGDTITYSLTATNTGTVTLTGITITDPLIPAFSCTIGSLAPGATSTACTAAYTVTQADIDAGAVTNTATATAPGTPNATGAATATGPAAAPGITLTKTAAGGYAAVGDRVRFTLAVRNTGNVTLSNVQVSDAFFTPALSCTIAALAPGATNATCTGTYTVTQADIDAGSITNTASVTGTAPGGGGTVGDTDTATVNGPADAPSVALNKTTAGTTFGAVGTTKTYTLAVTNTGPVTLTNIVVDDPLTGFTCPVANLAPGATATTCQNGSSMTAVYTITQADVDRGFLTNTASVTASTQRGTASGASDSVTLTGPQQVPTLGLNKTSTGGAGFSAPGQTVSYSYQVTNTGNFTLTAPVTVTDNKITAVSCPALPAAGLAPGASITCTGSYAVTQADIDAGSVTNAATARVTQPVFGSPTPVTASANDTATVPATQTPALALAKTIAPATPVSFAAVGDVLTYSFAVTNSGNTTIAGPIQVNDPLFGAAFTCLAGPLAPGAGGTCTRTYSVTQADLNAGSVVNTARAFTGPAASPTLQSAPDSATATAIQTPRITFTKSTTQTSASNFVLGNTINYSYALLNSGNVTLPGPFTVSDNLLTVSCPAGALAPGATRTCTGAYVITANDIALGRVTNNATPAATFNGAGVPTNSSSVTIPAGVAPALTMTKTETTGVPLTSVGQVLSYQYFVQNTGDAPFGSDVLIFDDKVAAPVLCHDSQGGTIPFETVASGNPPFQATCTASYTVTQADLDAGFVTNTAYAQSVFAPLSPTPLTVQSPAASVTVNAAAAPALAVTKSVTAGQSPAAAGDTLTYAIVTTNAGNQTISNITVTDPLIPVLTCTIGGTAAALPAVLAPTQALVCTGTYTVTQADVDAQTLTNTASASGASPQGVSAAGGASYPHPLVAPAPSLSVSKAVIFPTTAPVYSNPGDPITYAVTVTNTGNVTLGSVSVTDSLVPGTCTIGVLAPGATDSSCQFTYNVTQADVDAGQVTNVATASAQPANPGAPAVVQPGTLVTPGPAAAPALSIVKVADLSSVSAPGQVITYTYTVGNVGNVTITANPQVTDNRIGTFACGSGPIAPLGSVTCTAQYTVTQADINAGGVTNTATATATGVPVSAPAVVTVPAVQSAGMDVVKTITGSSGVAVGDTVDFAVTVANTGNVDLGNVVLADTLTRLDGTPIALSSGPTYSAGDGGTSGVLDVGETWTFVAQATITQADINAGGISNSVTVTATDPGGATVSDVSDDGDDTDGNTTDDTTDFVINGLPALNVVKSVLVQPDELFPTVWTVTFAIDVANTGNLTLTGFQVTDDLAAFAAPAVLLSAQYPVAATLSGLASATLNPTYDGWTDINLLSAGASIAPGETGHFEIDVTYSTAGGFPAGLNAATASSPILPAPVTGTVAAVTGDADGDGVPDGVEGCTAADDRDGDGICDAQDYDPTGYFYCQDNGTILTGGSITVIGPAGSQSGVGSSNNITIVADGSTGAYQFFVTAAGQYRLVPTYPAGFPPSTTRVPTSVPVDVTGFPTDPAVLGSSEAGSTGILADFTAAANLPSYLVFDIQAGDPHIVSNNLALEGCAGAAAVTATKTADRSVVRRGESVTFTLTFTNGGPGPVTAGTLIYDLPSGLIYTPGSGVVNGAAAEPVVTGRRLSWPGVSIPVGSTATLRLSARVTGSSLGRLENRGWLQDAAGVVLSNIASAVIRVEPEHVFDCSDVIGKVFDDRNMNGYQDGPQSQARGITQDDTYTGKFGQAPSPGKAGATGEPGLPGVRLVTTRGLVITTDEYGRYHVPCAELPADIGTNFTLKLDPRSLPSGYRLTTENPRTLRLTAGKMAKLNFGAAIANVVDIDLTAAAFEKGSVRPTKGLVRGVAALVQQMKDKPSVVRLGYLQQGEDRATIRARMDAVEDLIRDAWSKAGRYKLNVERTIRRVQ